MKNLLPIFNFIRTLNGEQTAAFLRLVEGISFKSDPRESGFGQPVASESGTDSCRCGDLFEVGDIVVLASGGPAMTLSVIDGAHGIDGTHGTVLWFDDDDALCEARVPLAALEHAPPPPPVVE